MTENYKEKYRPQFHFSPEKNWMNDPNGMVYYKGEYHLFYQHTPFSTLPDFDKMHWGHAVSKDLIHWEELPAALYPDENGAIFSGSAVVDWDNTSGLFDDAAGLVAIYTSHDTYPETNRPRQRQSIAYSKDDGRSWTKYEGNPVLSDENITDYRDPKVFWHADTNKWVMVLATGHLVTLYTSPNLKDWEFASGFGKKAGSHDSFWECPDLFKLPVDHDENNQKWVMIVSIGDNPDSKEGSRTQYFIGHFDGTTFVNDNPDETVLWLDFGRDNYAGVSWSDIPNRDGRRIYLGWMSNWRYANQIPTEKWRGAMTLPRELSLISSDFGVSLIQKPVLELSTIQKDISIYQEQTIESNTPVSFSLSHSLIEINVELERVSSSNFGITLQHSDSEKTIISYDSQLEKLFVDRTNAGESGFSPSFSTIQEAPMKMLAGRIKLQIFLDSSSVEVFANDGKVVFTCLIFPSEPCQKIVLFSDEGTTRLASLKLTELDSIWI
ncbi:glycoside hydrolase family 32 protein [Paenibacillus psychroresistens]|uniref:Glycoside hydrolase family 32 protein n=1 Tax=Paenibacillus psychroresistens TaxID=1778678 RepID=A0A6B8RHX7_9BACL|nr:glycoside hydrolase family 32 protein [Paenibacillus psychroresistens]QGQ96061.1 glycoside hydrolase family 32 protein [Paenibacillus psychroresistens]